MSNPSQWQQLIDSLFTPAEQEAFRTTGSFEVREPDATQQADGNHTPESERTPEVDGKPIPQPGPTPEQDEPDDENPLNYIQRYYENRRD